MFSITYSFSRHRVITPKLICNMRVFCFSERWQFWLWTAEKHFYSLQKRKKRFHVTAKMQLRQSCVTKACTGWEKTQKQKNILDNSNKIIRETEWREREGEKALEEPLALISGGWLFGCGAWKEPHESSSHPALVDNLRVTWEIQH